VVCDGEPVRLVAQPLDQVQRLGRGRQHDGLTAPGQDFFAFARESWGETKKVVWPTRKEATQTTAAVFGFVVIMAVFLWISDKSLEWVLYDLILGWKKS